MVWRGAVTCLTLISLSGVPAPMRAQGPFTTYRDTAGRFSIDYPKDWEVTAGAGEVVVTFSQRRREAFVAVERHALNVPIQHLIDSLYRDLEVEDLKRRQPDARSVVGRVSEFKDGVVLIDFERTGKAGPESLRQYSFIRGAAVIRMTCFAPTALFGKYLDTCIKMRDTVKILTSAPAEAPVGITR